MLFGRLSMTAAKEDTFFAHLRLQLDSLSHGIKTRLAEADAMPASEQTGDPELLVAYAAASAGFNPERLAGILIYVSENTQNFLAIGAYHVF